MEVQLTDIRKHFGPVKANDGISLFVPAGTIQGILGENGAGKSTLMKILSGFQPADSGRILLDGRLVHMRSPADAIRHGVGMLHQDPLDFPPMRVVDNLLIGSPGRIIPRGAEASAAVAELARSLGLSIDLKAEVGSLTVGERQQLELLRLLWLGASVLILDEPTTGISARQRAELFDTLRRLAAQGKTVIFVSHKLEEVQELCTRVAVLRQGRLVGEALAPVQGAAAGDHDVRARDLPRRTDRRYSGQDAAPPLRIGGGARPYPLRRSRPRGARGRDHRTRRNGGQRPEPALARVCRSGSGHQRPDVAGERGPHRQALPSLQEAGSGLRARLPTGGGLDRRPHPHRPFPAHPEEAGASSSTERKAGGRRKSASPSSTSGARRRTGSSRCREATSSGPCSPWSKPEPS